MKTIMTVAGIRPDFVRLSEVIRKLDDDSGIKHVLVHTGQHYDYKLSDVFFQELGIREPDYNLGCGASGKPHWVVSGEVTSKLIDTIYSWGIRPDIILFLGDSNSVVCSVALKKEGFRIGHIEAGMRSGDRRMLEETNRIVCDHCSDLLFVYHPDYAMNLYKEGIFSGVHVVGNTIVEVCKKFAGPLLQTKKRGDSIILDIHRPENFKDAGRMRWILRFAGQCGKKYRVPIRFLKFPRTVRAIYDHDLRDYMNGIQAVDLMSYKQFLEAQYHSLFMISDSGTAQEEPALLNTPVVVPREYTERPQSMKYGCSYLMSEDRLYDDLNALSWVDDVIHGDNHIDPLWLSDGNTSQQIVDILKDTV